MSCQEKVCLSTRSCLARTKHVPTAKLMAFTGKRVLNPFAISSSAAQAPAARAGQQCEQRCGIKRQRTCDNTATTIGQPTEAASSSKPATGGTGSAGDLKLGLSGQAGANTFASIVMAQAPTQLTCQQVLDTIHACKFFLAEKLPSLLLEYLSPVLECAPMLQV